MQATSQSVQTAATGYDQVTQEDSTSTPNLTKTSYELREGRSDRNLKSESTVARSSAEKANIAFVISFSVPLEGRFPTPTN